MIAERFMEGLSGSFAVESTIAGKFSWVFFYVNKNLLHCSFLVLLHEWVTTNDGDVMNAKIWSLPPYFMGTACLDDEKQKKMNQVSLNLQNLQKSQRKSPLTPTYTKAGQVVQQLFLGASYEGTESTQLVSMIQPYRHWI